MGAKAGLWARSLVLADGCVKQRAQPHEHDPYVLEVITGTIIVIAVLSDSLKEEGPGQIKVQNRCSEVEAFDEEAEIFRALRLSEQNSCISFPNMYKYPPRRPKWVQRRSMQVKLGLGTRWRWGWDPNWLEFWEEKPGEPNLAIRIPGRSGKPGLMFNGHADVVPVPGEELGPLVLPSVFWPHRGWRFLGTGS